jgi:hypothetical protein
MSDMSVSPQKEEQRALSREWLVARIVVIGGCVVAVAAIVWFGWVRPAMLRQEAITAAQQLARTNIEAANQMCRTGLTSAQTFGIVPPYGQLAGHNIYRTNIQGRYVCIAATHATRYLVAIDLLCRNTKDRRCVSLFSVTEANGTKGTVLYRRAS